MASGDDYKTLFDSLKPVYPPAHLLENILVRIRREAMLRAVRRRMAVFVLGVLGSVAGFVLAFQAVRSALAASGFFQFLGLLISDPEIVTQLWNQFVFSVLESLPALDLALLFAAVFAFLYSLRYLARSLEIGKTAAYIGQPA